MDQHRRVLVVDDDPTVRQLLTSTFRRKALVVDEASSGADAIALLRQHAFAVVLLDLLMEGVDGFAVLDAMKNEAIAPPVVLVITGADRSVIERLDPRRVHGVVRKPFDAEELCLIVQACTEIRARNTMETMALAMVSSANLLAWLSSGRW